MNCYKCGRKLFLPYDNFCCRRVHFAEEESRGKAVKEVKKKAKPRKRKREGVNKETRELVLKRDEYKCTNCGCKNNIHVHHIIHKEHGGSDEMKNLTSLCDLCHLEEHRGEAVYNLMIKNFWQYEKTI